MRLDDYTPEKICWSLGLNGFEERWSRTRPRKMLRLLFCPSFDPEACISLHEEGEKVLASVVIARTQIWTLPAPDRVAVEHTTSGLADITVRHLEAEFRAALATSKPDKIMLDGMQIHGLWRTPSTTLTVSENPAPTDPFGSFAAMVVNVVFRGSGNGACRDGLAKLGKYLGLDL